MSWRNWARNRFASGVPGVNILAGSQQVDGFEVALSGRFTDNWRGRIGYSYLVGHTSTGTAPATSALVNTPKDALTFWTDYSIMPEWTVGLGGQYISKRLAQNTPASFLTAPPYMTVDASSEYRFSQTYGIRLNVYNLADRRYIDEIHSFRAVPGGARSALLTLEVNY